MEAKMEIEVKEPMVLADGSHEGIISKVEYRETPYKYTDVFIKEKKTEMELKFGAPTSGSTNSKLVKLIGKFGKVEKGVKFDPEKVLVGRQVTFVTVQEETDRGTFTKIAEGSIKPKASEEKIEG